MEAFNRWPGNRPGSPQQDIRTPLWWLGPQPSRGGEIIITETAPMPPLPKKERKKLVTPELAAIRGEIKQVKEMLTNHVGKELSLIHI